MQAFSAGRTDEIRNQKNAALFEIMHYNYVQSILVGMVVRQVNGWDKQQFQGWFLQQVFENLSLAGSCVLLMCTIPAEAEFTSVCQ